MPKQGKCNRPGLTNRLVYSPLVNFEKLILEMVKSACKFSQNTKIMAHRLYLVQACSQLVLWIEII